MLERKTYNYMPKLINMLFQHRAECVLSIRGHIGAAMRSNHPPPTNEILKAKKSRFSDKVYDK